MSKGSDDHLVELLLRRAETLSEEAIQNDGQVSAEEVNSLKALSQLVEIRNAAQPKPSRKRWPLLAAVAVSLGVATVLLFARVPETEIELDAEVSEVSFQLVSKQVLTAGMGLSALGVAGLDDIRLPAVLKLRGKPTGLTTEHGAALRLSSMTRQNKTGTVTLGMVALPREARVWLRKTEVSRQYQLSLKANQFALSAHVHGPVRVGLAGAADQTVDFPTPKAIVLRPSGDEVDLNLTIPHTTKTKLSPLLEVSDLRFFRIDRFVGPDNTLVRLIPSVVSGALYMESLNGEKRLLRPGEAIAFERCRGDIRTIYLDGDSIALKFHGCVKGMKSGVGTVSRSLMPTYLDWLRARHGLSLLWGTTLYILGLIAGAVRWWGKGV